MSVYWNKKTANLSPYIPGEQPKDKKFIKLNTNENPYPPSPKVIQAIRAVLDEGGKENAGDLLRLYPDPLCTEFRAAVAKAYGVRTEQVFPGNGSDEVLAFAFGALFESAENTENPVLFPDISYSFYPVYARLWNVPFCEVKLKENFELCINDYLIPSSGVIIPNPNAPTGMAVAALGGGNSLETLAAFLLDRGKVLIVDQAYNDFGAESSLPLIERYPNLLTVHTLSKSAGLAGLRAGFAIGNSALIEGLFRIRDSFNSYTMDRLAIAGASAALSDKAYYDAVTKKVIAARERTVSSLAALGFEVLPSKANFIFTRKQGFSGAALFKALRGRNILVRHFNRPRIEDYLRVSIGTERDMNIFLDACRALTESA